MAQLVSLTFNRWTVIYLLDSAIQRLNNQGLDGLNRPNVQPMYSLQFKGLRSPQTSRSPYMVSRGEQKRSDLPPPSPLFYASYKRAERTASL